MFLNDALNRNPLRYNFILGFIIYFIYLGCSFFSSAIFQQQLINNLVMCIVALILSSWIFNQIGTSKLLIDEVKQVHTFWTSVLFSISFILFVIFILQTPSNLIDIMKVTPLKMITALLTALAAGFFEESLVRLLFLDTFAKWLKKYQYNVLYASLLSSILFGLLHLSNLSYQSLDTTLQQVFYTMTIGLCLSFIRVRSNRLSLCIFLHTLIDFQPTINSSSGSASWSMLFMAYTPFLIIAFLAIWSFNCQINKQLTHG